MVLRPFSLALLLVSLAAFGLVRPSGAGVVETVVDNDTDAFIPGPGTDWNYTEGGRITWWGEEGTLPSSVERLAARIGGADEAHQFGLSLGQESYTPRQIEETGPVLSDRPYAGWLYGGAFVTTHNSTRERSVELRVGTIGPDAQAAELQTWWHQRTGVRLPRGWRWQLHNEPGIELRVLERRRPWGYRRFADVVPHAGFTLGNVTTDARAGLTIRLGLPLPDDFGPSAITPAAPAGTRHRFTAYAFARAEGRAIARNVFLDGNTFASSQRVHRIPLVGESQLGAGVRWGPIGLRYVFSYTSNQYTERPAGQKYGSIGFSF